MRMPTSDAAPFHGPPPLDGTPFLAGVDFLACPDQADDHAPARDSLRELDEVLGLGETVPVLRVLLSDHRGVKGALSFIEDQDVLRRDEMMTSAIGLDVFLHTADERFASASCALELVLKHLHQRAISGEEHCWGGWLAVTAIYGQVVEPPRMGNLGADERLA